MHARSGRIGGQGFLFGMDLFFEFLELLPLLFQSVGFRVAQLSELALFWGLIHKYKTA